MFSALTLRTKLLSAFLLVTSFMIVIAVVGQWSLGKVFKEFSFITTNNMTSLSNAGEITMHLKDMQRTLLKTNTLSDLEGMKSFRDEWMKNIPIHENMHKEYVKIPSVTAEEEKIWKDYLGYWEKYVQAGKQYYTWKLSNDPVLMARANDYIETGIKESYLSAGDATVKIWDIHLKESARRATVAGEAYEAARFLAVTLSIVGVVLALLLGYFFARMIVNTILGISRQIDTSASETSSASHQLTSASSQLSQGATESAASLEETVSSLEELSSMVKLNSDHAKEANSLSQKSLTSAENGEKEISKLIEAMSLMAKSSKKIEEIINVIDDIAFQTNLLALNAAVEAARAGDQGKGFAVVADAVRNLAQRSASAAKDINTLIKENVEKTEEGVRIADTSGAVLNDIVTSVKKVADLNSEISAASQEQAHGIEQISKAMNHLDQAIQTNASSSEEVASSAEEMSSQAECLTQQVTELQSFVNGKGPQGEKTKAERPQADNVIRLAKSPKQKSASEILPLEDSKSNIGKAEGF